MATVSPVTIECVRAALVEHAPQDYARFKDKLREALHHAQADLDLTRVERVLRRWHAVATMAANPLSDFELAHLARARAGDITGLRERLDDRT